MSKYGVLSGPYFPEFGLHIEKHGPKKPPYLDTFHAVQIKLYFFAWKSLKTRMQDKISWINGLIKFLTSCKQIF